MNDNKQQGIRLLHDVWQNGNFVCLSELVHEDVRRHHERMPANNIEEYQRVVAYYRAAFSDLRYDIKHVIGEGDKVAILYDVTGTHTGPLGQIPATGVRDSVGCIDVYVFRDGRMSDIYTAFDELGLLMKLGVLNLGENPTHERKDELAWTRAEQSRAEQSSKTHLSKSLLTDVWQDGRFDLLPSFVLPNVIRHHPRFPAYGPAELQQMIVAYRTAFPDMKYRFLHSAEEGDQVALVYEVTGTHLGPFGQIPPTGIHDTLTCVDFFRFQGDRISEIWTMFDELGLMMKMGVVKM